MRATEDADLSELLIESYKLCLELLQVSPETRVEEPYTDYQCFRNTRREIVCWRCNRVGHYSRNCRTQLSRKDRSRLSRLPKVQSHNIQTYAVRSSKFRGAPPNRKFVPNTQFHDKHCYSNHPKYAPSLTDESVFLDSPLEHSFYNHNDEEQDVENPISVSASRKNSFCNIATQTYDIPDHMPLSSVCHVIPSFTLNDATLNDSNRYLISTKANKGFHFDCDDDNVDQIIPNDFFNEMTPDQTDSKDASYNANQSGSVNELQTEPVTIGSTLRVTEEVPSPTIASVESNKPHQMLQYFPDRHQLKLAKKPIQEDEYCPPAEDNNEIYANQIISFTKSRESPKDIADELSVANKVDISKEVEFTFIGPPTQENYHNYTKENFKSHESQTDIVDNLLSITKTNISKEVEFEFPPAQENSHIDISEEKAYEQNSSIPNKPQEENDATINFSRDNKQINAIHFSTMTSNLSITGEVKGKTSVSVNDIGATTSMLPLNVSYCPSALGINKCTQALLPTDRKLQAKHNLVFPSRFQPVVCAHLSFPFDPGIA